MVQLVEHCNGYGYGYGYGSVIVMVMVMIMVMVMKPEFFSGFSFAIA